MRINTIIIEDEESDKIELENCLQRLFPKEIKIIGHSKTVIDAVDLTVKFLLEKKLDLIFLDYELIGGNAEGFIELLTNRIEEKSIIKKFEIVFFSKYDIHSRKLLNEGGFYYLLKPLKDEDVQKAVNKFINLKENIERNKGEVNIVNYQYRTFRIKPSKDKLKIIKLSKIFFIESDGEKRTKIHYFDENREIQVDSNLVGFNSYLDSLPDNFYSTNRNKHLVNLFFIKEVRTQFLLDYYRAKMVFAKKNPKRNIIDKLDESIKKEEKRLAKNEKDNKASTSEKKVYVKKRRFILLPNDDCILITTHQEAGFMQTLLYLESAQIENH